jgi:hypothetical protein
MADDTKRSSQTIASWVQTAMLGITIVAAIMHVGKRDQQLEQTTVQVRELSSIVSDLTKTSVGLSIRTEQAEARLLEIVDRLNKLERSIR